MDDVALGVKVFKRTEKLTSLLESVQKNTNIPVVYVADDGDTNDRQSIYTSDWEFELNVIDLEYDAGLGRGRREIVDSVDREYLCIVDSDHQVPSNLSALRDVLEGDQIIGGVSGLILEHGDISGMYHDIRTDEDYIYRHMDGPKNLRYINEKEFVEFDFIPNAALFRTEIFTDYNWDASYTIGSEHLDFYLGHKQSRWKFGVCPRVIFRHSPGGSTEYSSNRGDPNKVLSSRRYLLNKFDKSGVVSQDFWLNRSEINPDLGRLSMVLPERLIKSLLERPSTVMMIKNLNNYIWKYKHNLLGE